MNLRRIVFMATLLLAGCAGKPTTYLALAPVPGAISHVESPPIAVARVTMPAAIDRLYLTSADSPTTLTVADHARWVAPLGGQAQDTLAADLAARLPSVTIIRPGDPTPAGGARLLAVNVTRFLPGTGSVVLNAGWRLAARQHHRVIAAGRVAIEVPAGTTPGERAAAMSSAIGRLADSIVRHLNH